MYTAGAFRNGGNETLMTTAVNRAPMRGPKIVKFGYAEFSDPATGYANNEPAYMELHRTPFTGATENP